MAKTKQAPRGIEIREILIRVSPEHLSFFKKKHHQYSYEETEENWGFPDDLWFKSGDKELINNVCREYWEFKTPNDTQFLFTANGKNQAAGYYIDANDCVKLYKADPDFTEAMLDVWDWEQDFGSYLIAKDGTLRHPDYFWLFPPYDTASQLEALVLMGYDTPLVGKAPITCDTAKGRRWLKARREAIG